MFFFRGGVETMGSKESGDKSHALQKVTGLHEDSPIMMRNGTIRA